MNKLITFNSYVTSKGLTLLPWQKEAADALLAVMYSYRVRMSGKSVLMELLTNFVEAHGNDFDLSEPKTARMGKLTILRALVEDESDRVARVFMLLGFVPTACTYNESGSSITYLGKSEKFAEIPEGYPIPEYMAVSTTDDFGTIINVEVQQI